jgi:hypothetical protein
MLISGNNLKLELLDLVCRRGVLGVSAVFLSVMVYRFTICSCCESLTLYSAQ